MPDDIYEIIALAARYWFLLLMLLIAWRSYRWYARDRKSNKLRLKLLPDAGYIGELVVVQGDEIMRKGTCIPVSREGVLGYLRGNDVCIPADGVANRHLWYIFDDTDGLRVEPFRGRQIIADGIEMIGKRRVAGPKETDGGPNRIYLSHGSVLQVGQTKMRLRMFSGFEYAGEADADRRPLDEDGDPGLSAEIEERDFADPIRRMHEIAAWQAMEDGEEAEVDAQEMYPPETDGEDDEVLPPMDDAGPGSYDVDDASAVFYPPVMDDEGGEPPESLYIEEDEAAHAKRVVWDKLFRGGKTR